MKSVYLIYIKQSYLTEGATITPIRKSLAITRGCEVGISNICFKKNVFNSDICQKTTSWLRAKNLIYVQFGSSQRTGVHCTGVNCRMALLILPVVEEMSLKVTFTLNKNNILLKIKSRKGITH